MTTALLHHALSLPRAQAFDRGLLVPVSRSVRQQHGIDFPVRFTAQAWTTVIDYPVLAPRRSSSLTPIDLNRRLDRFLIALHTALTSSAGNYLRVNNVLHLILPPIRTGYGHGLTATVIATQDEEGADVLTVLAPGEWQAPH